jgi:hypothetical protein
MNTDNKVLPQVTVYILEQERHLRYTMAADIKLKKLLDGKSVLKGFDPSDPEQFVAVLWSGLIAESPELDKPIKGAGNPSAELQKVLDNIANEVDISQYSDFVAKMMEAIKIFKPEKEDSKEVSVEPKASSEGNETEKKT